MHSSPGTPTGTRRPRRSSRWMAVLAIGRPMGTRGDRLPRSHCQAVTSTAASVGP